MPLSPAAGTNSEIYPQSKLPRPIPSGTLGQRGLQNPERWARDVIGRRRKISVIEYVRERRLEPETRALAKVKALGETHVHVEHVWALQDTHTAAPKPSGVGWGQSEGIRVVKLLRGLPGGWVSYAIGPRNGPARASHDHIGV